MTTFTKWFLLNAVVITGVLLAETKGAISLMIDNDSSYLTILIMALYVAVSIFVGRLCYLSDKLNPDKPKDEEERNRLLKKSDAGWFASEHFFSLGLLGTIIGLCMATTTSLNADAPLKEIIAGLKVGLNTAFYTTICGIVFSLPLQIQLMILKSKLEK